MRTIPPNSTPDNPEAPLRQCKKCGEWLPETAEWFYRKEKRGRLDSVCRLCRRELEKERWNRRRNKHNAERRARRRQNPELSRTQARDYYWRNREKALEWNHQNYIRHREERNRKVKNRPRDQESVQKKKRYMQEYYQANRERLAASNQRWYLTHLIKARVQKSARKHRRRDRENILPATLTERQWRTALDYFKNRCAVCGRVEDFWTVLAKDHWIPLAAGGHYSKENIIPLCNARRRVVGDGASCNPSKRDKDPEVWLIERFGKRKAKAILKRINDYFDWVRQQDK